MAGRKRRPRRTWPQRLLISFNCLLIATSLVAAGTMGYLNYKLDHVERIDLDRFLDPPGGEAGADAATGEPQNYLLVGTDSAERLDPDDPVTNGRDNLGTLSDTIMLLRVDPESTQAQLLSFPRDLWVTIPGYGESKINAALAAGGPQTLIQTIQENFGVPVNHYVEVDFQAFEQLVDAIDGVPIYFDQPLRDDETGLLVGRGCVTLDPRQALAYARSRHLQYEDETGWHFDGTGDLGRITRQQEFIRHAMQRAIAKGIRNPIVLNALIDAGIANITVDTGLTTDQLLGLGTRFRNFDPDELQTMSLDVYDDWVGEQSILRLQDTEANQRRFDIFKGVGGSGSSEAAAVRVAVNNGTGASGQATEVADGYAALGFDTSPGTGDAESFDFAQTVVRYPPGNEAIARFVAAQLESGAVLEEVGSTYVADVIVVTGADYGGVATGLAPPPEPLDATTATTVPGGDASTATTLPDNHQGVVPEAPEGQDCG